MESQIQRSLRPEHPKTVSVAALRDTFLFDTQGQVDGLQVTGITLDSRDVRPGDLYVGMPGSRQHGAAFAEQARERGAVAMLTDSEGWSIANTKLSGLRVEDPRAMLGAVSAEIFGTNAYRATFFGVTGTNGKTSVIYLLAALLDALGEACGISTTAERRVGDEVLVSSLTSPEASELHGLLALMRERRVTAVALEVSAQAVVRHRIDGVMFDVVAFNNFSQDHLDEFGSMENYFAAKSALFRAEHARRGVSVVDGAWGRRIVAEATIPMTTLATEYGSEADWHMAVTAESLDGTSFVLSGPDGAHLRARVPLLGRFMAENAALAVVMLVESGIDLERIRGALGVSGLLDVYIPGRLEKVSGDTGPTFFVDYGHTPGAFEAMLDALRPLVSGKIIMLFGADGDRDTTKRHAMGAVAAQGADTLVICDYNPRTEDPAQIREQLLEGARGVNTKCEIHEIPDPAEAIRAVIRMASTDDVILYAGPGHEQHREVAEGLIDFSARDEVRVALREAGFHA